jgi:hypothetical protein
LVNKKGASLENTKGASLGNRVQFKKGARLGTRVQFKKGARLGKFGAKLDNSPSTSAHAVSEPYPPSFW